jgi:hypothetical protein
MTPRFTWLPQNWMPYETKLYQTRSVRMWPIKKARMPAIPRFPANIT